MPNMSNNTSLYDYYNYDNFKVEHAPHNFAAQPKRLLPEQINMNISKDKDEYKDSKSEGESKGEDEGGIGLGIEKGSKSGMTDQITDGARKFGKFFMDIFEDKPEQKDNVVHVQAPTPVPFATPSHASTPSSFRPSTLPFSAPAPTHTNPLNTNNEHIGGGSHGPMQLGGGEYNMDTRSLMRKNRMLQNRIHELERDLYKSSH